MLGLSQSVHIEGEIQAIHGYTHPLHYFSSINSQNPVLQSQFGWGFLFSGSHPQPKIYYLFYILLGILFIIE